jgi:4-diphosphocytidyl-2-C-methyl-D-erythritol kinase
VTIDAPAKVNLFLEVLNKRADGYHNINSVFQAVSLFDRLEFTPVEDSGVSISISGQTDLSTGNDNLISLAYHLMKTEFELPGGLRVDLEKRIPLGAGLGGGSSDGAATIMACNMLFGLDLSKEEQMEMSSRIGSDLPFFFGRGQARVAGRGEVVKDTDLPLDYHMVLVNPGFEISTSASYASLKRGLTMSKNPFNLAGCSRAEELVESLHLSSNDFEEVHLKSYPEIGRIKDGLLRSGASLARMTGSGPTVFGIFLHAPELNKGDYLKWGDWQSYAVLPVALPSQD